MPSERGSVGGPSEDAGLTTADRTQIAAAILVRGERVLLAHRHPGRVHYPNCWDLVGGHVEPGERPVDAVVRECAEELGVAIRNPRPFPMTFSDPSIDLHAFLVTDWDGEPRNAAPDEHDDLAWFASEHLRGVTMADAASVPDIVRAIERCTLRRTTMPE